MVFPKILDLANKINKKSTLLGVDFQYKFIAPYFLAALNLGLATKFPEFKSKI